MDEVDLNSRGLVPMSVGMLPGALVGSSHRHPFNLTSLLLHNTRGYSNQQKGATGPRVAPLDSHLPHLEWMEQGGGEAGLAPRGPLPPEWLPNMKAWYPQAEHVSKPGSQEATPT